VKTLLGINIDKFFMSSVANIVGTDLSNYKTVRKNQFACNRMHVGRDYRIPISLSNKDVPFIVSPAYDVFEIQRLEKFKELLLAKMVK
jgi:type I restriction enzyme S subunit